MMYPSRNNNFMDQIVPTANLAEKVSEVEGGKCRSNELAEIVAGANEVEYEVGDMVWAKVKMKSYPWWPAHIFKEDWVGPSVLKTKKEGQVLVVFFGDNKCGWFDPINELKPFDSHYVEKSKLTKLPAFLNAVKEAEEEVSRRAALGLACWCHNLLSMRPKNYFDWFYAVNIKGHSSSGILISMKQIKRARDEFQPVVALSFLRWVALMAGGKVQRDVDWIKNVAVLCAYRKAVLEEIDEASVLSYGDQSDNYNYSTIDSEPLEIDIPFRVLQSRPMEVSEAVVQTKNLACSVELTDHMLSFGSVDDRQVLDSVRMEAELRGIYADLLALALNPYLSLGQNISSTVEKFVLQFRSIVYHKSQVANLSVQRELGEIKCKSSYFSASTVLVQSPLSARAPSPLLDSIPPKKRLKPDGYPMACQQSGIQDDREDISQRIQKGVNKSKTLAAEEKARNPMDIKSHRRSQEKRGAVHVVNESQAAFKET